MGRIDLHRKKFKGEDRILKRGGAARRKAKSCVSAVSAASAVSTVSAVSAISAISAVSGCSGAVKAARRAGIFCLISFLTLSAQAYPWPDFSGEKDTRRFSIGAQSSFFLKQKSWLPLVPTVDLKYENVMADVDLGWQYSLPEEQSYFRLSELALTFPVPFFTKWSFSLGFKDQDWSKADRYWNLGLWQARYRTDPFRPVQMGRPGFFLNYKGLSSFMLHLSYLSLPDMNIIPLLKSGEVSSQNPFFISPVTLERDSGKTKQITWKIQDLPPVRWSAFLKPVAAFQTSHKLPHFQLSMAYAYKPSHLLKYFVFVDKRTIAQFTSNAYEISGADYSINYHHLFSLEAEMSPFKGLTVTGALIYENPRELRRDHTLSDIRAAFFREPKKPEPTPSPVSFNGRTGHWVSSSPADHLTAGLFLYYREGEGTDEQTAVSFGYLQPISKEKTEDNFLVKSAAPLLGAGSAYTHAINFSLEYGLKTILHGCHLRFRLNHALDNKMFQASFDNRLNILPSLQVSFNGDILFQLSGHRSLKPGASSIQFYRDHSRALLGVAYVF